MWFEYIESQVNPEFIREIAKLEDEALQLTMAAFICSVGSGIKLPTKVYKTEYAKRLLAQGRSVKETALIAGITERQVYNLKKAQNGQN